MSTKKFKKIYASFNITRKRTEEKTDVPAMSNYEVSDR